VSDSMASDVNNNDIGSFFKLSAYSSGLDGKDKKVIYKN